MNFQKFRHGLIGQQVFSTRDITKLWPEFNNTNLVNWQDKGYIIKLRNNWYAFPETLTTEQHLYFIANRIYRPSYVSLETALRYYNFIPESIFSITSVTTRKTTAWKTSVGHFMYRTIRPELYFGYKPSGTMPEFLIASPEKALIDMLYLNPYLAEAGAIEELRLNIDEITTSVDTARVREYVGHLNSSALTERWNLLHKLISR